MASLILLTELPNFRVCTNDECKYKLCGITVAPKIPSAIYKASLFGIAGIKPFMTSFITGFAKNISTKKDNPMTITNANIKASILRMPLLMRYNKINVSKKVRIIPHSKGKPNKRFKPIAIPITSAKSVAIMAISANKYKPILTGFG